MKKTIAIITLSCAAACTPLSAPAAEYTKIGIVSAAKAAGKWDALKAWIEEAGLADEWAAAAYIPSDHPSFAAITNSVVATGMASAEEVAAILEAALDDTVTDAALLRIRERDCTTSSGRVKWHGDVVSQVIDTNAEKKVTTYADGWQWTERFRPPSPVTPKPPVMAKTGIPAALAAARARREAERAAAVTNNMTVTPDTVPLSAPSADPVPVPDAEASGIPDTLDNPENP